MCHFGKVYRKFSTAPAISLNPCLCCKVNKTGFTRSRIAQRFVGGGSSGVTARTRPKRKLATGHVEDVYNSRLQKEEPCWKICASSFGAGKMQGQTDSRLSSWQRMCSVNTRARAADTLRYAFLPRFINGRPPQAWKIVRALEDRDLTLEQVYGAITYYLAHRADIDRYLQQADAEFDALRQATRNADPQFHAKLMQARRQSQTTQVEK